VPFTQILPLLHILPHEPQLLESVFRLAQAPLQIVWLLEQVIQEPAAQAAPDAHLCRNSRSYCCRFSCQRRYCCRPSGHPYSSPASGNARRADLAAPHACPQEPQLLVLVCVLTQVLSQIVFEQLVHWPAEQYWPVAQTLPHVPQLLTSVCRL